MKKVNPTPCPIEPVYFIIHFGRIYVKRKRKFIYNLKVQHLLIPASLIAPLGQRETQNPQPSHPSADKAFPTHLTRRQKLWPVQRPQWEQHYRITDALMCAFAVFFFLYPSLLHFQRAMKAKRRH
jgi:hypothetical protein